MAKLWLIIRREYLAKVRNKSFVVMTFLSPILLVGMVVLIAYLTQVNDNEKRVVAVLNQSAFFGNSFTPGTGVSFVDFKGISLEAAKDSVTGMGFYGLLHLPPAGDAEAVAREAFLYTREVPSTSVLTEVEDALEDDLRAYRLEAMGVTPGEYAQVRQGYDLQTATFRGERSHKGINEFKAIVGGGFGYLIMMFIIIYGGFVMRSVIEEKTSRIIEVIISSVKPFQLMMGKIIGTSLAGVTQFLIWILSAGLLLTVALLFMDIDPGVLMQGPGMGGALEQQLSSSALADDQTARLMLEEFVQLPMGLLLFFFLVYFVLGYLIYSSIYAAIGAAVDNETDTQQFILPVILPLMLAIYVGFFSVFSNPHGPIAVAFSIFPLTSPIVMLMRLPSGIGPTGVPYWELAASLSLLLLTFIGIVWLAAKIYRIGILMYGKKPTYKELYKWLKY
ncbi:ABC transporter permease [Robiginitalea sp. M366]|uniref:ABC transporter permease n=1 Tax=Robiginitalea aestuariiviva TaxID=3036903 RepID=UPI00240E7D47|nr:ABC transporter permease [Robiginitalea aestuariiviva]MDG1572309.1 ABC transporter permease [Robiginitalea aestuariiviva]